MEKNTNMTLEKGPTFLVCNDRITDVGYTTYKRNKDGTWQLVETTLLKGEGDRIVFESPAGCYEYKLDYLMFSGDTMDLSHQGVSSGNDLHKCNDKPEFEKAEQRDSSTTEPHKFFGTPQAFRHKLQGQ